MKTRVFRDKDGYLWLDPGNGEVLALDSQICRALQEKWPTITMKDAESQYGKLNELSEKSHVAY